MVTSKPRTPDKDQLVKVNVWKGSEQTCSSSRISSFPVAVFAKVRHGHAPVLNASVSLHVKVESENGRMFSLPPIWMKDTGSGGVNNLTFKRNLIFCLFQSLI